MGNKLTSTQVTAMNAQRGGPKYVSHCKCLQCPEEHHKPREWPANTLNKEAKGNHSLTSVVILLKQCLALNLPP